MEIDIHEEANGSSGATKDNGHYLYPVSVNDSGEGLPYAPVDFPNPGDRWSWKVGKRITNSGYFHDRYLYLPSSLQEGGRKRASFKSRLSVEQYIRATFPGADVNAFFASFSWHIPSKQIKGDAEGLGAFSISSGVIVEHPAFDSQVEIAVCKAGNKMCSSLLEGSDLVSEAVFCDICCTEPGFCRDCCCILCCKTVDSAYGGYSFIKCEAPVVEGFICGHMAHLDCGLRSYMAGTVGGSIGLDAEYYCRRCDSKTDLVVHAKKLLQTCESIESHDDIEKIMNVSICMLSGSQRTCARQLLEQIDWTMNKLNNGTYLEDVGKKEDNLVVTAGGMSPHGSQELELENHAEPLDQSVVSPQLLSGNFDHRIESLKLEDEIEQTLLALKESQESEYKLADERLRAQKTYIQNLYEQLDRERTDISRHLSSTDSDALLDAVMDRVDQIKKEIVKLKDMEQVGQGFGKTSKEILKEHYGLEVEHMQ